MLHLCTTFYCQWYSTLCLVLSCSCIIFDVWIFCAINSVNSHNKHTVCSFSACVWNEKWALQICVMRLTLTEMTVIMLAVWDLKCWKWNMTIESVQFRWNFLEFIFEGWRITKWAHNPISFGIIRCLHIYIYTYRLNYRGIFFFSNALKVDHRGNI